MRSIRLVDPTQYVLMQRRRNSKPKLHIEINNYLLAEILSCIAVGMFAGALVAWLMAGALTSVP